MFDLPVCPRWCGRMEELVRLIVCRCSPEPSATGRGTAVWRPVTPSSEPRPSAEPAQPNPGQHRNQRCPALSHKHSTGCSGKPKSNPRGQENGDCHKGSSPRLSVSFSLIPNTFLTHLVPYNSTSEQEMIHLTVDSFPGENPKYSFNFHISLSSMYNFFIVFWYSVTGLSPSLMPSLPAKGPFTAQIHRSHSQVQSWLFTQQHM